MACMRMWGLLLCCTAFCWRFSLRFCPSPSPPRWGRSWPRSGRRSAARTACAASAPGECRTESRPGFRSPLRRRRDCSARPDSTRKCRPRPARAPCAPLPPPRRGRWGRTGAHRPDHGFRCPACACRAPATRNHPIRDHATHRWKTKASSFISPGTQFC